MKKFFKVVAMLAIASMLLVGCGGSEGVNGSYTTKTTGFAGSEFEVTTTFKDSKITKIEVGENNETEGIGKAAMETMIDKVISSQSIKIDAVTGATLSSNALLEAVKLAIKDAGLKEADFSGSASAGEDQTLDTEVVVVGGGGAGLSAAVSAAQNGAKVILIEKTDALGGNTVRAGGPYNAVDPEMAKNTEAQTPAAMENIRALAKKEARSPEHQKWMDQLQADLDAYDAAGADYLFDSIALHVLQTYDGGDYVGKLPFIEFLVTNSLDTANCLHENGLTWRDQLSTCPGGLWPRAHIPENAAGSDYIVVNSKLAKDLGVEIIMDTAAKELITDGGRVVGVKAQKSDGTNVTLNASKGVILASGGFAANKEMRKQYNPSLGEQLATTNNPAMQGDGIVMAQAVGADVTGMEWIQCLPLGNPETGGLNGWVGGNGCDFYYQVNKEGKRFMAEDGRRDYMTNKLLEQDGSLSYVITDTNVEGESGTTIWGDNIEDLVATGKVYRANTIEELATQIGCDPAVLAATNAAYNASVDAGVADEFGRTLFSHKIEVAPFYASPRMPTVHHTMGGLVIDLECRVLDAQGNAIPGLFAAGEVTGGIHGANRLGGNALVDIHVFGKVAGETAAAAK